MMFMFSPGGGAIVQPMTPDVSATSLASAPGVATCTLTVSPDGSITVAGNEAASGPPLWFQPATPGIGANFKAMLSLSSGTAPQGPAIGSYNLLSSQKTWTWTRGTNGILTFEGVLNICDLTDAVISSVAVHIRATRTLA